MAPSNQTALPCPSWVWSNNSTVHTANDKSWFGDDYRPINSFCTDMFGNNTSAIGIGTVVLQTKLPSSHKGPSTHSTICLRDVLHTPSSTCNIIGNSILDDYSLSGPFGSGLTVKRRNGEAAAYFEIPRKLLELRLAEPPFGPVVGPSPFKPGVAYVIHAFWPDDERIRVLNAPAPSFNDALMPAEKAWLKKHYKSEYYFLRAYGLSIYKQEDRARGRSILRALMSEDSA